MHKKENKTLYAVERAAGTFTRRTPLRCAREVARPRAKWKYVIYVSCAFILNMFHPYDFLEN